MCLLCFGHCAFVIIFANLDIYFLTCNKSPFFFHLFGHFVGECHKLRYRQLLGPFRHDVALEERRLGLASGEHLLEAHAQHLPPLVEDRLHEAAEQCPVASEVRGLVACHPDDGTLDLWRRVEDVLVDSEEILHVVPCLDEDGEDAVGLVAGLGGDAQGHLTLYHSSAAGDEVFVVEHLEEYLTGYVVGVVAGEHEGMALEELLQVHAQEVLADDVVAELWERRIEVLDAFLVDFHGFHLTRLLHEKLCQHTHAGSYLQHWDVGASVDGVGDAPCYVKVGKEVLSQVLLRSYSFHHSSFCLQR